MALDIRLLTVQAMLEKALDLIHEYDTEPPTDEPIMGVREAAEQTVTPTVQSDGYEFEVQHHRDVPTCNHQHQKLVGNELRCANCDAVLQTTGVIGRNITTAPWARAASEGAPDQPNREGT